MHHWPAGRWAGDQVMWDGLLHVSAGWQLSAWVPHSPLGDLSSPRGLAGLLSCWSQGYKHSKREQAPDGDIQVSACVVCTNILLLKANWVAKPKVRVDGSHQGRRFWDLLQPFSENSLLSYLFGRRNVSLPFKINNPVFPPIPSVPSC